VTWQLTAAGHCDDPEHEADLARRLATVLSAPKYGCHASQLGGEKVNGPVHEKPAPKAADDDAGEDA